MRVLLVVPVCNEEQILEKNVERIRKSLSKLRHQCRILIADNASTDSSPQIAKRLGATYKEIGYVAIPVKGRGNVLHTTWSRATEDIVSYMDLDLSTRPEAFVKLIGSIASGCDIATGSRYHPRSTLHRGIIRLSISQVFNFLCRVMFGTKIQDLQCGFKAMSKQAARKLLPEVNNRKWFFDTELLLLAEHNGHKVCEVPIVWNDSEESKVVLFPTIWEFLSSLVELKRRLGHQ
jgi:glycosyltransferase involved in cell wall biosynthesis